MNSIGGGMIMNHNKSPSLFLSLFLTLIMLTSLFIGCNNGTAATAANVDTFGDYAAKGQTAYNDNCTRCHGNTFSTSSYAAQTLSYYNNAQTLLNKINTMSGGSGQSGLEVLSYLLVEHGWVSANTAFDESSLPGISLPRP
jgi:mono/diheme cytochrome c family protein